MCMAMAVGVTAAAVSSRAEGPALPPDSEYCVVDADGHLSVNGKRVRFWGAIGSFPGPQKMVKGDPYFFQREAIRRAKVVGFNMYRLWDFDTDPAAKKGDLSKTDRIDFFVAECARQGFRIWGAGFGGGAVYESDITNAAGIVSDSATADEWAKAVRSMCKVEWWTNGKKALSLLTPAVAWDRRLEALAIEQTRVKVTHTNTHTGLRHCDDPTFAIWELTNEQWWMSNMMGGQWQRLPVFFRAGLIAKWNAFLLKKYGDEAGLIRAWGFLFPGENLVAGTVLLAPMADAKKAAELNDTNPEALAKFKTIEGPIGRDQCTVQRGSDVIEFLLQSIVMHKQRCGTALKTTGRSCKLSPLLYDTGIGQSIHAQYMQMHADAVAHASYQEGDQSSRINEGHKRYPFYSGLDRPPQMCNDVPWLEHNRPIDKPFLCYETQYGSPSKYRAEWPVRVAALGSVQDWDAACYHYWHFDNYKFTADAISYAGPLAQPGDGAYQYEYFSDEIEQASMRAAGAIFRNFLVTPAPKPTIFRWGRPALFDPRAMDYAGDYGQNGLMDMMMTTYANGVRLVIDPNQKEFLKTDGPVVRFNGFERHCPLQPSPQVEYDYNRGYVVMDSPGAAAYTGFFGEYGADSVAFRNGVKLGGVVHLDPPGTPFPSGAERYTSFTLASDDGKPLAECRKAVLALVASSFNTGLTFNKAQHKFTNWGREPVLITRVGATVAAPALAGMKWKMIDFSEKTIAEGTVGADGVLVVPADKPVWLTELRRE